jgi:adenosylmethionine-8-amino-7-oxononanoate aminotransferase
MPKCPKDNVFYRNLNWHYPKIVKGKGIYLYGEDGKRYIDGCSGSAVANIGHGNEEVAKAMEQQAKTIAFTHLSRFTTDAIANLADKIAEMTPGDLNKSYFVSGGSEATETAIKMTRQYFLERDGKTTKYKIIARKHSFHGNTIGALSMTGHVGRRRKYIPYLAEFPHIVAPYCYRCPYKESYPECGVRCAYALEEEIKEQGPENVAGFIAEPVVGSACPGMHPPKEYFSIIREICDKYDVLMIIDEVMAGFGRTGKNFGIDHYGVVPDIMTTAKGMSCGYSPLGAAVVSDKIYDTFAQGSGRFVHGHTYGGNPLSCAVGCVVLDIIKRENYIENARIQGDYLMEKLQKLYEYPIVGDIRGKGLMIGIEFVKDQKTKEPFDTSANIQGKVTVSCLNHGLVVYPGGGSVDGIRGDHILIAPPINITGEEIDELFDCLEKGIKDVCESVNR